jgi:nucleotide-binding universal stress UspA family protein
LTTRGRLVRTIDSMNTAAVIGDAMTDYLLAAGTNKAPANRAPAHMAAWMRSHGYRIVRSPVDPGDPQQVARIAAAIDWQADIDAVEKYAIVREVLAAANGARVVTDVRHAV